MIYYKDYDYIIGIDPGVNTGFAVWDNRARRLKKVETNIACYVENICRVGFGTGKTVLVRFEDARLRTWFGKAGKEQLQGAGSIKRDCQRWEEFLTYYDIPFEEVAPKNNRTKMTAEEFKRLTGWNERTSSHARDAAMLVFGL
jgi:hypothetical protein